LSPLIRKERIWPVIIITVLCVDVGVGFALVRLANSDPHAAIEANYYQKAVTWDSTLAQARANAALRWTLAPSLGVIGPDHQAMLTFRLRDGAGAALGGAAVMVEARHVAHAEEVVASILTAAPDSNYAAPLLLPRPGLWELRVVVTRGSDRYSTQLRFDASTADTARLVVARPGDAPGGL
jgi:nitrogen fixation protein FixH